MAHGPGAEAANQSTMREARPRTSVRPGSSASGRCSKRPSRTFRLAQTAHLDDLALRRMRRHQRALGAARLS
jgi:hypothetical protein